MQQRAASSHEGGTWGIPGGARDSHETPVQAALREAAEEAGVVADDVEVTGLWHDDHDGWEYTTVVANVVRRMNIVAGAESAKLRWTPVGEIDGLVLHPGFAAAWPKLKQSMTVSDPHVFDRTDNKVSWKPQQWPGDTVPTGRPTMANPPGTH
jgi:8-oxo-dGTP diphosphatase